MFKDSNHAHWELFVPKRRPGSPFKEAMYFRGGFSNPKGIFRANHLYMGLLHERCYFCLSLFSMKYAYRVCILLR